MNVIVEGGLVDLTPFWAILNDSYWGRGECDPSLGRGKCDSEVKGSVTPVPMNSKVVTWGDEMYGGNCRALKDQLKDVQGIQVSRQPGPEPIIQSPVFRISRCYEKWGKRWKTHVSEFQIHICSINDWFCFDYWDNFSGLGRHIGAGSSSSLWFGVMVPAALDQNVGPVEHQWRMNPRSPAMDTSFTPLNLAVANLLVNHKPVMHPDTTFPHAVYGTYIILYIYIFFFSIYI